MKQRDAVKRCPKCNRLLPLSEFGKNKHSDDGYTRCCKECVFKYVRKSKLVENKNNEVWKEIDGFENYFVSNLGRVKRVLVENYYEKIVRGSISNNGYVRVQFSKNNIKSRLFLHRLVATAFIPNINNYNTVNHKDYDKLNNCVDNLEWMDITDNLKYSIVNHFRKHIIQYTKDNVFVKEWESAYQVEKELGWFSTLISRCCRGKQKTYKGYIWRFKN